GLRLAAVALNGIGYRLGYISQGLVNDLLADAACERLGANTVEPLRERRSGILESGIRILRRCGLRSCGLVRRGAPQQCKAQNREQNGSAHAHTYTTLSGCCAGDSLHPD